MSIGSTIKKLRHENDMTQEQLADLLGLTAAAVSGWECDRNAPDISQIPQLSHIFGVSADTLLGIDLTAQEDKIAAIIDQAGRQTAKGAVEVYRLGLAEFPASYKLMLRLADALDYRDEPDTYDVRLKESIALYEKVREGTKDAYLKNYADGRLCSIYIRQGKRDDALKIAESVPKFMYSHDELERMVAQGMERVYNMHHSIHCDFASLCDDIYFFTMQQVEGKAYFSHEQAITMLEKIPKLYEIFYENGDYFDQGWIIAWSYARMAEHYAEMGDADRTLRCVGTAVNFAKKTDEYYVGLENGSYGISDVWDYPQLPKEKRHTSILASPEFDYPTCTFWFSFDGESHIDRLKKDFSHERFDFVREGIIKLI